MQYETYFMKLDTEYINNLHYVCSGIDVSKIIDKKTFIIIIAAFYVCMSQVRYMQFHLQFSDCRIMLSFMPFFVT